MSNWSRMISRLEGQKMSLSEFSARLPNEQQGMTMKEVADRLQALSDEILGLAKKPRFVLRFAPNGDAWIEDKKHNFGKVGGYVYGTHTESHAKLLIDLMNKLENDRGP